MIKENSQMKKKSKAINNPLMTHYDPKSVISEKFRGIRTNIMFSTANDDVKTLVITSEKPGVGKSLVSANIAVTYAQAGYKTLLIDGDMRKPTQHYMFNTSNIDGLSNLIISKSYFEKAITKTEIDNLDLLTSGPIPPNPSELIGSIQFQNHLEELKEIYDFIIIDTPPVNTVTDAQLFSEISGYAALVINVKNNDRKSILKSKELIENTGAKVLGVVLNKTEHEKNSSYYAYYGEES
ncbi:capsular biosynthesis protein [Staphylococcus sp. HMSC072B07]|nr:capsular exopolysaccharide family protein [Staphylococcus simulans]OFM19546.1 capsular biosynthesis protein [Staphylococcus sp. HMSC059E03]OFN20927.1 capsular biosynthesis protein [Staphylococcus sp. HMSC055C03]OFO45861.1 capsular biosynthesis protein [Staphylococcus sp. HMSC072B07]OFP20900.1 capsular biosynthesis protein [Staphylococcus sp. HMSC057C08]OFU78830.1 capsular biosynthesis protein [Staphylococcus sp. HMSC10C03]OFV03176.1 capsular biosynthesis protein [Staphylococcus sp. HMSC12H